MRVYKQIPNELETGLEAEDVAPSQSDTFERHESGVRSYCRTFPMLIDRAQGSYVYDVDGKRYLDFLCGASSLNYGHNPPELKRALVDYIAQDGVVNALDFHTRAKERFLREFHRVILKPRELDYRVQFCGPTGANAIEAALKLAKKYTGRKSVVSFSNSYHGMSAGAMSVSSSFRRRNEEYLSPAWVNFLPFDGFTGQENEIEFIRAMLTRPGSGYGVPAAFILELVQGEGGVNVASKPWVQALYRLSRELNALFIVDDIQAGCGRTGRFFSFEHFEVVPDIVCMSKSISGYGFPMSILLLNPTIDVWAPGEHNGTFRGFAYSFVTATEALLQYWDRPDFARALGEKSLLLARSLEQLRARYPDAVERINQLGLVCGIKFRSAEAAQRVQRHCFENGLIVESCGPDSATLKLLPPLTAGMDELEGGLRTLLAAMETA
ncbi:diaminobutyrate--2-oxoglutarate transaminase [Corallococcus llansteffanensis]|uniref:Diaminobutyrate--2-oxoglutarate transaminase n=1 Tax=Corallococcus llansteffanensis TaxID=2316731 RepID=A0A3A8QKF0_9BACT|nr:diaminobutyrate--2-oxoglutarate transaminase [Corallococcus llansteffanensis]RKH68298.1 diaminobutyrate--2-oxoglutarate transaminase [Corallococcus llansteffanensis]